MAHRDQRTNLEQFERVLAELNTPEHKACITFTTYNIHSMFKILLYNLLVYYLELYDRFSILENIQAK